MQTLLNGATVGDVTPGRFKRSAVGKAQALVAAAEATARRSSCQEPSPDAQRDALDFAHRSALARFAAALRKSPECFQPLSTLARKRALEPSLCSPPEHRPSRRPHRLAVAFCRFDHRPRPSARGGSKRGDAEEEALGRSQGGFSTKIHIRAEGAGKPLVFL